MARINDVQIIEKYLLHCERQGKTSKCIEDYMSVIRIFKAYLERKRLDFLDVDGNKEILEGFLDYLRKERQVCYARIKIYFSALSHFYDYLAYNGYIKNNVVLLVRKMYVRQFKNGYVATKRKIIEVEEMSHFLNSIMSLRDKTIALVFVKTGIRRGELISIDVDDIDFSVNELTLKDSFRKRSNTTVLFDEECANILRQWIKRRKMLVPSSEKALFIGDFGGRLKRRGVYDAVVKWATRAGFNEADSDKLKDHFSPHNLRHCFTTYLMRNGMRKEYVQELRGDKRGDVIDIYNHIDERELKKAYLSAMPVFNV